MKHITTECVRGNEEYISHTLKLTDEEREQLTPFLKDLGVQLRMCSHNYENGVGVGEYQAKNIFLEHCMLRGLVNNQETKEAIYEDLKWKY